MSRIAGALLAGIAVVAFTASPAAASTTVPAQSVTLEQTGGLSGEQLRYTVDQNTTDTRRNDLLSKLGQPEFLTLAASYGSTSVCCDRFRYELVVRYPNGQVKTVSAVEGGAPAELWEAVELTQQIATEDGSVQTITPRRSLLFVELATDKWSPTLQWSITCAADGSGPAACASLNIRSAAALAPIPPGTACTRIYGGSQVAHIFGVWQGEWVNATFSRVNGCEIARWDLMSPLLTPVG